MSTTTTAEEMIAAALPLVGAPGQRRTVKRFAASIETAWIAADAGALRKTADSLCRAADRGTLAREAANLLADVAESLVPRAREWDDARRLAKLQAAAAAEGNRSVDTKSHNARAAAQYAAELRLACRL